MGIYIALGGNLSIDDAPIVETFRRACESLKVIAASSAWQSPSWPPGLGHPDYVNAVIKIETKLPPLVLLEKLNALEAEFGRARSVKNAPRTLDLDILDYDGLVLQSERLTLPHPRMTGRGFVLFPLAEIAKQWRDPVQSRAVIDHIARLPLADVEPMRRLTSWYKQSRSG